MATSARSTSGHSTLCAATAVKPPAFEQAEKTIECRTIYTSEFDPTLLIDAAIEKSYPEKDNRFSYYGEIVMITGTEKFFSQK